VKRTFAERRALVLKRNRAKAEKEARAQKGPTALQRYVAEGIPAPERRQEFPTIIGHEDRFPLTDEDRERRLEAFGAHRKESVEQVVRMLGMMTQSSGLTFDELLFHHEYSGWHGPMTVSERQRNAAYKAWDTMRARKAEQNADE
jgi:hypothetical protein